MRCLVTSVGSSGDFLPPLAVAVALQRRGHTVQFVANPSYESRARRAGLKLVPAGEPYDVFEVVEKNAEYFRKPANARRLVTELIWPNTRTTFQTLQRLLREEPADVVVGNTVSFGAVWGAAEAKVPSVLVHPTPLVWMGWRSPVIFGDSQPPEFVKKCVSAFARSATDWYLSSTLRPMGRILAPSIADTSMTGTEALVTQELGMWSPALFPPQTGQPERARLCGFVRASRYGGPQPGLSAAIEKFLSTGTPPVVLALGSVFSLMNGPLLKMMAEVCQELGQRCLVVGHPEGVTFPANTLAIRYAPYEAVFGRASVVVGHGGAGTTGEILRGGRPALILPFGFDQFGLSRAAEQQGLSIHVPMRRRGRADLKKALQRALNDEAMGARAAEVGAKFAAERDGAEVAADAIEELVVGRRGSKS